MKLVFVNRFFYPDLSATSQMLSDAAFYLAGRGHEVHVVTSRLSYEGAERLPASEEVRGVSVHRIWTSRFGRGNLMGRAVDYLTFYVSAFIVLLRLLRQGDRVIAKTDPPLVSVPVGLAARIRGASLVNWLQDIFPEVAEALGMRIPGFATAILRWLRDGSVLNAETNLAIGDLMRNRLLKLGAYTDRVIVVPNWADGEAIKPLHNDNALRRQWGLQDRFVVGYSGNLGRAHEIETLLGAIRLLQDDTDIVFLFIGSGALMDQLKDIVSSEGLTHVEFKPYQPRDLLPLSLTLPDVHLTILKPKLEGLIVPSKIYGVLAAGRPSIYIGDRQGEVGDLITTHEAGFAIAEHDVNGLVDAIRQLKTDEQLCESMGARARTLFDERFQANQSLARLEQALC